MPNGAPTAGPSPSQSADDGDVAEAANQIVGYVADLSSDPRNIQLAGIGHSIRDNVLRLRRYVEIVLPALEVFDADTPEFVADRSLAARSLDDGIRPRIRAGVVGQSKPFAEAANSSRSDMGHTPSGNVRITLRQPLRPPRRRYPSGRAAVASFGGASKLRRRAIRNASLCNEQLTKVEDQPGSGAPSADRLRRQRDSR